MSSTFTVSIVVIMHNAAAFIQRCAKSIFIQTHKDLDIIFIDDFSNDQTLQKLNEVILAHPDRENQVRIIRHNENKGVAYSRNTGLSLIVGKYLLFVDSDDWIEPSTIKKMVSTANETEADVVWANFFVDFEGTSGRTITREESLNPDPQICIQKICSRELHAGLWNKLLKTSIIKDFGLRFHEELKALEDLAFVAKYLEYAKNISPINNAYYHYVQHPDSVTVNLEANSIENEIRVAKILENTHPTISDDYLNAFKATVKRNMLFSGFFGTEDFKSLFPEANPYLRKNRFTRFERLVMYLALNFPPFIYRSIVKARRLISDKLLTKD